MFRYNRFLLAVVLFAIATSFAVAAQHDVLVGNLGAVDVWSDAEEDPITGLWTYTYEVFNRADNAGDIHVVIFDNPMPSPFFDATNDRSFVNPVWSGELVVQWLGGEIKKGESGHFSFTSMVAPSVIPVNALVLNAGTYASGYTIGMGGAVIPEPSCLLVLGGMLGGLSTLIRGRRK